MHRPGDITYYEELGVANNASPAEIRDAFRALVRLLHPDQQLDEQLKIIAERQMRKINRIYAVLSDAERRRRYDDILQESPNTRTIVFSSGSNINVHRLMARFAWVGAVIVTIVVLFWLASENPAAVSLPRMDRAAAAGHPNASSLSAANSANPGNDVVQLRSELNAIRAERDAAVHELLRLRGGNAKKPDAFTTAEVRPQERSAPPPAATTITELPSSARTISLPIPPPQIRSAPAKPLPALVRKLAGFWFYTRPGQGQHNRNTALYPPEFIEATITEQAGVLHGRYRSRYQIVDRAISPDVNFEFTGSADGSTTTYPWLGPGGARGDLTLKLTGENSMEIEWTASELGSLLGLVSGTARLTRRVE